MFEAAALTLQEFSKLSPEQKEELTHAQLRTLLEANDIIQKEGKDEPRKPISTFLVWMKDELFSVLDTIQSKVDQPLKEEEIKEQILYLKTRYESIEKLAKVAELYKDCLRNLKEKYDLLQSDSPEAKKLLLEILGKYTGEFFLLIQTYLGGEELKTYRAKNTVPFPIEIAKLPLAMLAIQPEHLKLFSTYQHDLINYINEAVFSFKLFLESEFPLEKEQKLLLLDSIQAVLQKITEFHEQYDMETLKTILIRKSIQDFRGIIGDEYKIFFTYKDKPTYANIPLKFINNDETSAKLKNIHTNSTLEAPTTYDIMEYESLLTRPYCATFLSNCKQNVERINANLKKDGSDKLITEVIATTTYGPLEGDEQPVLKDQVVIDGKGIWVTLKVSDNGHGFPSAPDDVITNIDGQEVRMHTLKEGVSTQGGKGIGLSGLKNTAEKAGGVFKTYSLINGSGATTSVSFPLLRRKKPTTDAL